MKSLLANARTLEAITDKATYKARIKPLQARLHELQRACWKGGRATIVVFEGWDTAGRAAVINKLTERLEPRGFQLHTIREPRTYEAQLPWMWRFWKRIPAYGEMAIFDYSWYRQIFVERVERGEPPQLWKRRCRNVVSFERALVDDGTRLIKFFLHISRDEKKKRLLDRLQDPLSRWRVKPDAWEVQERYDEFRRAIDKTLKRTHSSRAPWNVLQAQDLLATRLEVMEILVRELEGTVGDGGESS